MKKAASLVLLMLSSSCCDRAPEDYYPLQLGSVWTYRVLWKAPKKPETIRMRVLAKEKVGEQECFKVGLEEPDGRLEVFDWLAVTKDGVRCHQRANGQTLFALDPPQLILRLPLKVGDSWDTPIKIQHRGATVNSSEGHFSVEAEEQVTVPAGRFKAMKVMQKDSRSGAVLITWLAPGVGMVRQVNQLGGKEWTQELEKLEKG